jgi:hypothetical protein
MGCSLLSLTMVSGLLLLGWLFWLVLVDLGRWRLVVALVHFCCGGVWWLLPPIFGWLIRFVIPLVQLECWYLSLFAYISICNDARFWSLVLPWCFWSNLLVFPSVKWNVGYFRDDCFCFVVAWLVVVLVVYFWIYYDASWSLSARLVVASVPRFIYYQVGLWWHCEWCFHWNNGTLVSRTPLPCWLFWFVLDWLLCTCSCNSNPCFGFVYLFTILSRLCDGFFGFHCAGLKICF